MRKTDAEVLSEVEWNLQRAEAELSSAIAIFGPRCGGYRHMVASWADYKKAVGTLLRLRYFARRVEFARKNSERWGEDQC